MGARLILTLLNTVFYIAAALVFLFVILYIIIFFVNVDAEDMILPPFMQEFRSAGGEIESYSIFLGNGIKITTDAEEVELADIKTVIYAGILVSVVFLLILLPVTRLLYMLTENIKNGNYITIKNPQYIFYIGIAVCIGGMLTHFTSRFYNYYLLSHFLKESEEKIFLSLGMNIFSALPGLLIIIIAFVLHYIFKNIIKQQITPDTPVEVREIEKIEP